MKVFFNAAVASALCLIAAGAQAQMRRACAPDIKAQCADVQPKGGALMDCMAQHRDQLTIACKTAIADQMLARRAKKTGGAASEAPASASPIEPAPATK